MSYEKIIADNKAWVDETFAKLDKKLSRTAVKSRYKIPYTTKDGVHDDRSQSPHSWINGFWGGLMWLMYNETKNEDYKLTALESERIEDVAFEDIAEMYHDVGFMWHIMAGANYRITGDKAARNKNLICAMSLMSRYNAGGEAGDFIRAWNNWGDKVDRSGWTIIDCMMNVPLLYWASRELKDDRFTKIGKKFADMAMNQHVRPDGSVNHIVCHDVNTGAVVETLGGQGYGVGSCWSRGDAWALYGFILSYIHTKEERYLDTAKKVAQYFISNIASTDWLPKLDFRQPDEPMLYDSTAGAIAACGMIEIAKAVPEFEKDMYLSAAVKMLKAMEANWCNWEENEDSILQMGSEQYHSNGIHMPIIYGDYYFTEAILKLKGSEFLPW